MQELQLEDTAEQTGGGDAAAAVEEHRPAAEVVAE